jgi:hypothetical protein
LDSLGFAFPLAKETYHFSELETITKNQKWPGPNLGVSFSAAGAATEHEAFMADCGLRRRRGTIEKRGELGSKKYVK